MILAGFTERVGAGEQVATDIRDLAQEFRGGMKRMPRFVEDQHRTVQITNSAKLTLMIIIDPKDPNSDMYVTDWDRVLSPLGQVLGCNETRSTSVP